jgi:hypothetical protein
VRIHFRRVAARLRGPRGVDRWLARLPVWASVLLIACLYVAAPSILDFGMAQFYHQLPFMNLWGLCGWFIVGCGLGGSFSLGWLEQGRRLGLAEVARG